MFPELGSHPWAYPALGVVHIIGIALLLGNLVLLELRVFGFGAALPIGPLARLSLLLAATGFTLAAASGLLMFSSQPAELLSNRAFTLKMLLLLAAACNAAWFHGRNSLGRLDRVARVQMVGSTLIWLAVVGCGRWIAYL
ncbi:MAG: hypothetical protein LH479_10610 [Polaromonas sp.]|nr:hypothetical protein [Polaromonas sp.]